MDSSGFASGFVTEGMGSPGRSERKKKQNYALFALAGIQPLFFWYLSLI